MNISIIIITKNEENNIVDCIDSAKFSKQIIVVDNNSSDRTIELAKNNGAHVITEKFSNFSKQREAALKIVKSEWIFYLDADERITHELKEEIEKVINSKDSLEAYQVKRRNFYLGKNEWKYQEKMIRLFKSTALKGWVGDIHESPNFEGNLGKLNGYLDHYTHTDLTSMLAKTIKWSDTEAKIRFDANHPKMSWWRFPRVMIPVFFRYYIKQRGYKLGVPGLVESMFQTYSIFITYAKLWEMQKKST